MLEKVLVEDWMTSPVISITSTTSISAAHKLMKEHAVRRLPVTDKDKLVGIITLGDVRSASPSTATSLSIWELNSLWETLTVERVMTRVLMIVKPTDLVFDAARIMLEHKISGLPVLDDSKHIVGIITESDIFRMVVTSKTKMMTALS